MQYNNLEKKLTIDKYSKDKIENLSRIKATQKNFMGEPILFLAGLASLWYSGDKLLKQYESISKIANLKTEIESVFNRLTSLGISKAHESLSFNQKKYEDSIMRCQDNIKPFSMFEVNISCSLDAYLTFCYNMIISLAEIYIIKANVRGVNNMRSLLSTKDEFLINTMLLTIYNRFCFALDYIYQDDNQIIASKWKRQIDEEISKLSPATQNNTLLPPRPHNDFKQNQQYNRR